MIVWIALVLCALLVVAPVPPAQAQSDQVTWGVHINLAPTWLDPAESSGIITPLAYSGPYEDVKLKK